ncbi:MAG: GntR family transcriptional regulator [Pseudomonadota bacterium]
MTKAVRKTQRGPESVYDKLRRQIVSLEVKPGADLDESSLVKKFGVSRTPVREALIRLSAEGLVEIRKNRGAIVTSLDLGSLRSIFEAGDLVERAYTRLACLRKTKSDIKDLRALQEEFAGDMARQDVAAMVDSNTRLHLRIAQASGNKYFVDAYRRILADHERIAQLWYADNFLRSDALANKKILKQHAGLVSAIAKGDSDTAERISMEHSELCRVGISGLLARGPALLADVNLDIQE